MFPFSMMLIECGEFMKFVKRNAVVPNKRKKLRPLHVTYLKRLGNYFAACIKIDEQL